MDALWEGTATVKSIGLQILPSYLDTGGNRMLRLISISSGHPSTAMVRG